MENRCWQIARLYAKQSSKFKRFANTVVNG